MKLLSELREKNQRGAQSWRMKRRHQQLWKQQQVITALAASHLANIYRRPWQRMVEGGQGDAGCCLLKGLSAISSRRTLMEIVWSRPSEAINHYLQASPRRRHSQLRHAHSLTPKPNNSFYVHRAQGHHFFTATGQCVSDRSDVGY